MALDKMTLHDAHELSGFLKALREAVASDLPKAANFDQYELADLREATQVLHIGLERTLRAVAVFLERLEKRQRASHHPHHHHSSAIQLY